jgi:glucosamine 6-phosphate synthetase-like amidotransferase/phosphosugar isomerase protein
LEEIYRNLASVCTVRGSDASGIAYASENGLVIEKRPCTLTEAGFIYPKSTAVFMAHCRRDLEGNFLDNQNNHPFLGETKDGTKYALAHNGILSDLRELRNRLGLYPGPIKTDSFGAVMLINNFCHLTVESLRNVCQSLSGSYLFTIIDEKNNLYLCRGDVPVYLVHFKEFGLFIYVSTRDLMERAIEGTIFKESYVTSNLELMSSFVTRIPLNKGEIVRISPDISSERFIFCRSSFRFNDDRAIGHNWYRHEVTMSERLKVQINNLNNV